MQKTRTPYQEFQLASGWMTAFTAFLLFVTLGAALLGLRDCVGSLRSATIAAACGTGAVLSVWAVAALLRLLVRLVRTPAK